MGNKSRKWEIFQRIDRETRVERDIDNVKKETRWSEPPVCLEKRDNHAMERGERTGLLC